MALKQPVSQVSEHKDGYGTHAASLANDGNHGTIYEVIHNSCAGSNRETNPWWIVDLGYPTTVCLVKLTNVEAANGV